MGSNPTPGAFFGFGLFLCVVFFWFCVCWVFVCVLGWFFVLVGVLGFVWFGFWVFCKGFIGVLFFVLWWCLRLGVDEVDVRDAGGSGGSVGSGGVGGAGGVGEGVSAEGLLLLAAEHLRRSIEVAVRQLNARKVRGEMKLKWSRALTGQVEALVKIAQALSRIEGESGVGMDLATFLSDVERKVPRRYVSRRLARAVRAVCSGEFGVGARGSTRI